MVLILMTFIVVPYDVCCMACVFVTNILFSRNAAVASVLNDSIPAFVYGAILMCRLITYPTKYGSRLPRMVWAG